MAAGHRGVRREGAKLFPTDRAPAEDGTKALDSALQRHGYSRDKRPDCLQVVVALVLTPDGFPLAYEVLPGNTSDKGTQMAFVRKLEAKYGQIGNLWLMDRGVPTEETLREMRESHYHYLVGAPHGHLKAIGERLEKAEWVDVQPGIRVKSARAVDENGEEGDLFVLTHSAAHSLKETAMRAAPAPDHRQVQDPQDGGRHPADHRRPHHHSPPLHRAARRHGPPARPARPDPSLPASPESLPLPLYPHAHGCVVKTYEQNLMELMGFTFEYGNSGYLPPVRL